MVKKEEKTLDKTALREKIADTKKKLLSLRLKKSTGELEKPLEIRSSRKEVARLFTQLNKKN